MKLEWTCILIIENLSEGHQESKATNVIQQKWWNLGVRVWCFGGFTKIDGNSNSVKYIMLLKDNLIADLDEGEIFQHDWAPCHRLHATLGLDLWRSLTILKDWSAQTLDFKYHQANVDQTKQKSVSKEELLKFSYREWFLISVKMVKDLYVFLLRCIEAIILAKGSYVKY